MRTRAPSGARLLIATLEGMSPYRRNVFVGVTVLASLITLAWMILKFGGNIANVFAAETIPIRFVTERADGVVDGSSITYHGIEVGHVTRVWLDTDRRRVNFEGTVGAVPPLPANLVANIRTASLLGAGSMISLETDGTPTTENLAPQAVIEAKFVGLGEILPPAFSELANQLSALSKQLQDSNLVGHLNEQIVKAGRVIDSVDKLVGDEQQRADIKAAIANLRDVTEQAKGIAANLEKFSTDVQRVTVETQTQVTRAGDNIESLTRQMGERLTQIAQLLDRFQSITTKIDTGKGSAGQLVNDTRLYESLVDTSRELNATIKDFKRLVEQWEQEGISFKLK